MPLINGSNVLAFANNFRVLYIAGRYGGGKTAFAFQLAYELVRRYKYRYVLSNVESVWCDKPEDVVLREEAGALFVDAVIILDEGGMFLSKAYDAKDWLAYLRKLNIVLIIPSVIPPARLLRNLTVSRTFNGHALALPMWMYSVRLNAYPIDEKDWFIWWQPREIWGIYDTLGQPSEASELMAWFKKWTAQAADFRGYKQTAKTARGETVLTFGNEQAPSPFGENSPLDEIAEEIADFTQAQEDAVQVLSALGTQRRRGGR